MVVHLRAYMAATAPRRGNNKRHSEAEPNGRFARGGYKLHFRHNTCGCFARVRLVGVGHYKGRHMVKIAIIFIVAQ